MARKTEAALMPNTLAAVPLTLGEAALLRNLLCVFADGVSNLIAEGVGLDDARLVDPTRAAVDALKDRLDGLLGVRPARSPGAAYYDLLARLAAAADVGPGGVPSADEL